MTLTTGRDRHPCTKCFRKDAAVWLADLCAIPAAEWPDSPGVCKSCSYDINGALAYLRFYDVGTVRQQGLMEPEVLAKGQVAHARLMDEAAGQPATPESDPPTPQMVDVPLAASPDGVRATESDVTSAETAKTRRQAKSRA